MDGEIPPGVMIRRSEYMIASEIGGQYLVMSIEDGNYVTLRDVPAWIWQSLEKPRTAEQLVEAMQQEYGCDPADCGLAVAAMVKKMVEHRLLTLDPPELTLGPASSQILRE